MKNCGIRGLMLAAICCLVGACQQTSVPPEVARNLEGLKGEMRLGRAAILDTGESVKLLKDAKAADIDKLYMAFDARLTTLEEKAGGVRMVSNMATDRSADYFEKWDKEINSLSDADTRARAAERRTQALAAYQVVKDRLVTLRGSFKSYMDSLKDTQKMVGSDRTMAGINTAKPTMEKALQQQEPVIRDLDAVMEAIDKTQP